MVDWYAAVVGQILETRDGFKSVDGPLELATKHVERPLVDRETWGAVDGTASAKMAEEWKRRHPEGQKAKPKRERPAAWADRESRALPRPLHSLSEEQMTGVPADGERDR